MLTEIITIGDELLIGQVVDTNSAWMAQHLNALGIRVKQITSVSDDREHILKALAEAARRVDIILITGGLGPTKDDITKVTLCEYFNTGLRFDERAYEDVERLFKQRGREITPTNRKQAEVLENCTVLYNSRGTAPGMWVEDKGKIYVSMPGVPFEMKTMMEKDVLPRLTQRFTLPAIVHKTILTQGIGESFLSDLITDWEDALPQHIKLAYLPSPGMVRLRLSAYGEVKSVLEQELNALLPPLQNLIAKFIYGYEDDTLEGVVGQLLLQNKATLSTAESCTGGYIAHRITSVSGSSAYFKGAVVAYDNAVKENQLQVPKALLDHHGAVSEEVVTHMAKAVRQLLQTDYSIACSGVAGPTGGTEAKPVGTVWIAVGTPAGVISKKLQLGDSRERVIHETALYAMNLLRKLLSIQY